MTIRHTSAALSLAAVLCLCAAAPPRPNKVYGPEAGPRAAKVVDSLTIEDAKRKKSLEVRIYHPDGDDPFPVIVFSHGFAANKEAFETIGKHWASHGYVSIHAQHADAKAGGKRDKADKKQVAIDKEEQAQPAGAQKGGFKGLTLGGEKLEDRVRDISAVLDGLDQIEKQVPALKGKLDRDRIAVSGHSFGACTTMLIGGVTADVGKEKNKNLADPRVKCILPFSAAGTGEYGLTKQSWDKQTVPVLYITGTKDLRPGYQFAWRREPFDLSPKGNKSLLIIDGATHFHFGGRVNAGRTTDIVKTASVAFWDAHLKGSADARAFLTPEAFGTFAKKAATLEVK